MKNVITFLKIIIMFLPKSIYFFTGKSIIFVSFLLSSIYETAEKLLYNLDKNVLFYLIK